MPETELGGEPVSYEVRNSDRARYPRIDVNVAGVTVVIPEHMDLDAETFLQEKQDWVLEKEDEMSQYREQLPEYEFTDGAAIPLQGEDHTIHVTDVDDHRITGEKIQLSADTVSDSTVKDELRELYRETARDRIHAVIDEYAPRIDGEPNQVFIKNQKTRWGSCSSKNNLNFNWRLLLAPEHVLEYVVVHELVHLEQHDHSDAFWSRLEELLPTYEESRRWLEENGHTLIFTEEDVA